MFGASLCLALTRAGLISGEVVRTRGALLGVLAVIWPCRLSWLLLGFSHDPLCESFISPTFDAKIHILQLILLFMLPLWHLAVDIYMREVDRAELLSETRIYFRNVVAVD